MIHDKNRPTEYYPDLMEMSSETIVTILNDFGYEYPECIRQLTWNGDYAGNAKYVSEGAIEEIEELYRTNRKAFSFSQRTVFIEMGTDKENKRRCESWKNTLPPEMKVQYTATSECGRITIDRKELENRLGYKLGGVFSKLRR